MHSFKRDQGVSPIAVGGVGSFAAKRYVHTLAPGRRPSTTQDSRVPAHNQRLGVGGGVLGQCLTMRCPLPHTKRNSSALLKELNLNKMRLALLALLALAVLPYANAQVSTGTAFSVAPQLLVTNHHVISGCRTLSLITPEGRRAASVVSSAASSDLALLRVFGMRGALASVRNPRSVALGETVLVFGFPLTGTHSSSGNFTGGLVSSLQGLRNAAGKIQITAPVQPGNSGGPVVAASGLIVGVVLGSMVGVGSQSQ